MCNYYTYEAKHVVNLGVRPPWRLQELLRAQIRPLDTRSVLLLLCFKLSLFFLLFSYLIVQLCVLFSLFFLGFSAFTRAMQKGVLLTVRLTMFGYMHLLFPNSLGSGTYKLALGERERERERERESERERERERERESTGNHACKYRIMLHHISIRGGGGGRAHEHPAGPWGCKTLPVLLFVVAVCL